MKEFLITKTVATVVLLAQAIVFLPALYAKEPPQPASPEELYNDLFIAVQSEQILPDGKDFADAIAIGPPAGILADYHRLRPETAQALAVFVKANFTLPTPIGPVAGDAEPIDIGTHIDQLWEPLTRGTPTVPPYSSLLPLPRPYVVPGVRFRELYYWDSYFTMLGLAQSRRPDLVEDMVRDFAYLIDTYGHVPNGTRTYYLSRSQPPFFFKMVGLLAPEDPATAYVRYLPQLKREYAFWMQGASALRAGTAHRRVVALSDGSILNRYWDDKATPRDESYLQDTELAHISSRKPSQLYRDLRAAAESGWDFGSRWLADGQTLATIDTTEVLPVDLNSLLFGLESAIRSGCERAGEYACVRDFDRRLVKRRAAVNRYLWNASRGAFLDYRWTRRVQLPELSAASLYPLFVGMASEPQAAALAVVARRELLRPGGLATTTVETTQQWDLPNGWAPLQWIAVSGLRDYAQQSLAEAIACRWMMTVNAVYHQSGKLIEKYDVLSPGRSGSGGEYALQDGFGWTNGVMKRLMALYPADAAYSSIDQCPKD
jgi:alpha,alpha-trehalase